MRLESNLQRLSFTQGIAIKLSMGNGPSASLGAAAAQHKVKGALKDAQAGLTGATSNDPKQAELAQRAKDRNADYDQKKKEHAEKKKKLSDQWAANKKANK